MKIAEYQQMMDYLTGPRERFRKGGSVTTPKRGLVDEPGSYAGKIPFTKKQKTIAEAFAKKNGIKVEDLTGSQRKDIRDGMYTLDSLKQTKSEKNFEAGKVRKLNNLKEFKPIDPDTGKIYTKNKWLSVPSFKRVEAVNLVKDPVEYKQRLKISKRKTYLKNREKIIKNVMDYYYDKGGKEKSDKRRDIEYKKGPLKGKAGLLQAENNRLLKYMSVAAEFGNPKFEIYEEGGKFAGVRDTNKNIIYRDHRYKGNTGVPITAHPDYENTMNFAKTAKKFKYDRPDKLLGSYFAKYERVPTYAEMYNFFQRDPRVSERTKIQNPLELHHTATMEKYPTKSYQLALFDKNTGANKIINDYNTPGSDAFKNKALADKRLKDLNIRLKIGGEFLGGGAETAGGALTAAKTKTTGMFKTQVAENPQLADEMAKYLGILGCGKADGGRIEFQTGGAPTQECIARGAKKINNPKLIKPGAEARNAAQFLNKAAKIGRTVMKFGVIPEAIWVAGASLYDMGQGASLSEALLRGSDYLLPGNQGKMADRKKFEDAVGPVNAEIILRARDYKDSLEKLETAKTNLETNQAVLDGSEYGYTTSVDAQNQLEVDKQFIKTAEQNVKNKFQPEAVMDYEVMKSLEGEDIRGTKNIFKKIGVAARDAKIDDIEQIAAPGQEQQGVAPGMFGINDFANAYITDKDLQNAKKSYPGITKEIIFNNLRKNVPEFGSLVTEALFTEGRSSPANRERFFGTSGLFSGEPIIDMPYRRQSSYIQSPLQLQEENKLIEEGARFGAAGGGIMKIAGKSSGPPPRSGPTPQGLDFLIKRGRQS